MIDGVIGDERSSWRAGSSRRIRRVGVPMNRSAPSDGEGDDPELAPEGGPDRDGIAWRCLADEQDGAGRAMEGACDVSARRIRPRRSVEPPAGPGEEPTLIGGWSAGESSCSGRGGSDVLGASGNRAPPV